MHSNFSHGSVSRLDVNRTSSTTASNCLAVRKWHNYPGRAGCSPIHTKKGLEGHAAATRFWDELLLLKVNQSFLAQCITNLNESELKAGMKLVLNELFGTCSLYLDDENFIRVAHSLETLIILFQEIFKKRFSEQGFTIITLIAGSVENADMFFMRLIGRVANLLQRDDVPIPVKSLCLRLYLTVLTATDNINSNAIASYLFQTNIFSAILAAMSVKLMEDRRVLELDATLVLILLLLWRESRNIYAETLSSSSTPVIPLLQAAHSLMTHAQTVHQPSSDDSSFQMWSVTNSVYDILGTLFGLNSGGNDKHKENFVSTALSRQDEIWLCTTAGIVLSYFVVYHYPLVKSTHLWPSIHESSSAGSGSLSSPWLQLLRSIISMCGKCFGQLSNAETKEILQAKCCLNVLRCLVESREALEFLAFSDVEEFTLKNAPREIAGIPHAIPSRSILCVILDNIIDILHAKPNSFMDPDLLLRGVVLIPIVFNGLKLRGWQLLEQSIGWLRLWNGLIQVGQSIVSENCLQRPGATELVVLIVGVMEFCLGSSQDLCSAPEVSEALHAVVMAHMATLEALVETTTSAAHSPIEATNINSVKLHYEIQIAALGVRGHPTYEHALKGVQKKGMLSLKLRAKHAGRSHAYAEGTAELGLLINTARSLVALHRKKISMRQPKLELLETCLGNLAPMCKAASS
ncbi:hypothetical protein GOP47_0026654 [Adiantum capillus-veneris]|nr:hypothetical protein GOP47_0026654 [Adiantum capillus-veneris]